MSAPRSSAECHGKIYHQQQDESRHAGTLRLGTALREVPLPGRALPDPLIPSIAHAFTRKADDRIEVEVARRRQVVRAIVEYAVGSGRHGITMVARDSQGVAARGARVSYFAEKESWGETKGIDFAPREPGDFIGIALAQSGLDRCLSCHTTWFSLVDPNRTGPRGPAGDDH